MHLRTNIVTIEKPSNINNTNNTIVPQTQTQIVDVTQGDVWLQDRNRHSFPVQTTKDNFKDFKYEDMKKNAAEKEKDILASLNCDITKIIPSPDMKSIV